MYCSALSYHWHALCMFQVMRYQSITVLYYLSRREVLCTSGNEHMEIPTTWAIDQSIFDVEQCWQRAEHTEVHAHTQTVWLRRWKKHREPKTQNVTTRGAFVTVDAIADILRWFPEYMSTSAVVFVPLWSLLCLGSCDGLHFTRKILCGVSMRRLFLSRSPLRDVNFIIMTSTSWTGLRLQSVSRIWDLLLDTNCTCKYEDQGRYLREKPLLGLLASDPSKRSR